MSLGAERGIHSPESIHQVPGSHYMGTDFVVAAPSLLDLFFKIILLTCNQLRIPHYMQPIWRKVW